jgi:hypothetical protein
MLFLPHLRLLSRCGFITKTFFEKCYIFSAQVEFGRPGIYLSPDGMDTILAICCEHITEIR